MDATQPPSETDPQRMKVTFYFQTWEGEAQKLLEDNGFGFSAFLHQGWLMLSLSNEDGGIDVVGVNSEGEQHTYLSEKSGVFPQMYGYENALLVLIWDKDIAAEDGRYIISEIDLKNHATEQIYQTANRITALSGDEQHILFTEMNENQKSDLCLFDKQLKKITESAEIEKEVAFAVKIEDKIILSERGRLGENLGSIYAWEEDKLVKTGMLPFVAEDNVIANGKKNGNNYLWKSQKNGFLFDAESENLYVLDFKEIGDTDGMQCMEEDGFSTVLKKDGNVYYVKYKSNDKNEPEDAEKDVESASKTDVMTYRLGKELIDKESNQELYGKVKDLLLAQDSLHDDLLDTDTSYIDIKQKSVNGDYYLLENPEVSAWEDYENRALSVYSSDYVNEIFNPKYFTGEYPLYIEEDNKLYRVWADGWTNPIDIDSLQIWKAKETEYYASGIIYYDTTEEQALMIYHIRENDEKPYSFEITEELEIKMN